MENNIVDIRNFNNFAKNVNFIAYKKMNRLKAVLAEQHRTGKWLAETMGRNEATVSRWCSNKTQHPMETMRKIAELLDVDVKNLLVSTKEQK